ncbi:unnamed protein product [Closterium sp. Naga37s-1]|nr:unnamed protein product [Closterium sp. Naga37s-1]
MPRFSPFPPTNPFQNHLAYKKDPSNLPSDAMLPPAASFGIFVSPCLSVTCPLLSLPPHLPPPPSEPQEGSRELLSQLPPAAIFAPLSLPLSFLHTACVATVSFPYLTPSFTLTLPRLLTPLLTLNPPLSLTPSPSPLCYPLSLPFTPPVIHFPFPHPLLRSSTPFPFPFAFNLPLPLPHSPSLPFPFSVSHPSPSLYTLPLSLPSTPITPPHLKPSLPFFLLPFSSSSPFSSFLSFFPLPLPLPSSSHFTLFPLPLPPSLLFPFPSLLPLPSLQPLPFIYTPPFN